MLTLLAKLLKALNSETGAWALAFAFVLGMVVGFTPVWRVHNLFILLFALIFRVNLSAFIVSFLVCSGLAYLLDPTFHSIGYAWLANPDWQGIWAAVYSSPWMRIFSLHHSITLGSLVVAAVMAPIVAVASYYIVINYRLRIQKWFNKLRIVQALKANKFWSIYTDLRG